MTDSEEASLDRVVRRLFSNDRVKSVDRHVEYSCNGRCGEMDLLVVYKDGVRVYVEHKATHSLANERRAVSQIMRALNCGVADTGVYVAGSKRFHVKAYD